MDFDRGGHPPCQWACEDSTTGKEIAHKAPGFADFSPSPRTAGAAMRLLPSSRSFSQSTSLTYASFARTASRQEMQSVRTNCFSVPSFWIMHLIKSNISFASKHRLFSPAKISAAAQSADRETTDRRLLQNSHNLVAMAGRRGKSNSG